MLQACCDLHPDVDTGLCVGFLQTVVCRMLPGPCVTSVSTKGIDPMYWVLL